MTKSVDYIGMDNIVNCLTVQLSQNRGPNNDSALVGFPFTSKVHCSLHQVTIEIAPFFLFVIRLSSW